MTREGELSLVEYSVLLIDPNHRQNLVEAESPNLRLLKVLISPKQRPARAICKTVFQQTGLNIFLIDLIQGDALHSKFAIAEILNVDGEHSYLSQIRIERLGFKEISDEQMRATLEALTPGQGKALCRVGWIAEAIAWVESQVGSSIASKGAIQQFNAGHGFTLLRFPTSDERWCWLKATHEPNLHELSVTVQLDRLMDGSGPHHLPRLRAIRQEWNAWIMDEDATALPNLPSNVVDIYNRMKQSVVALAALQISSIGKTEELLSQGAFDQRTEALRGSVSQLFAHVPLHPHSGNDWCSQESFELAHTVFETAADKIDRLGIPDTVLHGDLNWGNLLFAEHAQLIDWSETYIGHPLISLWHLLMLVPVADPQCRSLLHRALFEEYCDVWRRASFETSGLRDAFTCAPFLAAFSALYARGTWFEDSSSTHVPSVRNILPHLLREAQGLRQRGVA